MNSLKGPSEKGLTLPEVFQLQALALASQSNKEIMKAMKAMRGEDSTGGKSPRGSVLDRAPLTAA